MKRFLYMLTILPVLLFTACEDSGTNNDEVQHFEADGLILTNSGVKYLVYYQGNFTIHEDYGHDGHLEFGLGVSPGHTEVTFLDEDSVEIDPPTSTDYIFMPEFGDTSIVDAWYHDADDEGGYEFHFLGKKEGETTVTFKVLHGDHADFTTLALDIRIEDTGEAHGPPHAVRLYDEESGDLLTEAHLMAENEFTNSLTVTNGSTTDHIEIVFVDDNGVEFQPSYTDHAPGFVIGDTGILSYEAPVAPEYWAFKLAGETVGETTLQIQILHTHPGEPDEVAVEFTPVTVVVQ
jgi:hypothetical protein